jgi:hypothetical protein
VLGSSKNGEVCLGHPYAGNPFVPAKASFWRENSLLLGLGSLNWHSSGKGHSIGGIGAPG